MAMTANTKSVINYLKDHNGEPITAADIAEALNIPKRSVDGAFTMGIAKKGWGVRTPVEVELEDGTHKQVKLLSLTDEGLAVDPDQEAAE